jgi:chromosome segregation ATPase
VGALKQRILDLCASLQTVQDQNAELVVQNTSAISRITSLDHEVQVSVARAEGLALSLEAKTAEVVALRADLEETVRTCAAQLATAEDRLASMQALSCTQAVNIADLSALKMTLVADLARRQSDVAMLTEQKEDMEDRFAHSAGELQAQLNTLTARNAELQADVDQQSALASMLRVKVKGLQEESEECAHKLVHETAALEQCRIDLSAAKITLTQCQATCDTKVASLMDSVAQSQKVQELMASQLHERIEQVAALEKNLHTQTVTVAVRGDEIAKLEGELVRLRADKAAAAYASEEKVRGLEQTLATLRTDQAAQEGYINEIEAQRKAFKAELALKVEEIERLEQQLEKLMHENKGNEAHVTKLRVQLAAAQAKLEEEGHKRIHQLAVHEQKLSELEVAKVASDHALQRYEAKVAALTAELGAFTTKKSERMSI